MKIALELVVGGLGFGGLFVLEAAGPMALLAVSLGVLACSMVYYGVSTMLKAAH